MALAERIQEIVEKHAPASRISFRCEVEGRARSLVLALMENPTVDLLDDVLRLADEDWNPFKDRKTQDRFGLAFRGANGKFIRAQLDEAVRWIRKLWEVPVGEAGDLVDQFLRDQPIQGAGRAFPTFVLYLRDPQSFNVWLAALERGLGTWSEAQKIPGGYRAYNEAVIAFRDAFALDPRAIDVVLTVLDQETPKSSTKKVAGRLSDETESLTGASIPDSGNYFSEESFVLLVGLDEDPTAIYYQANKEALRVYVEEPVQRLLKGAVALLPPLMKERLETEKRLFGRILKNDFGQGGAWPYVWGALYPKGGKRTTDAQLFVFLDAEGLSFGFWVGASAAGSCRRFEERAAGQRSQLLELLDSASISGLRFGEASGSHGIPGLSSKEWLEDLNTHRIRAAVFMSPEEVLATDEESLAKRIANVFHALFPFFCLATDEGFSLDLDSEDDVVELSQPYPIEQFSHETGLDEVTLQRWVAATRQKGQAILYGPPGTGKTYVAERMAKHLVADGDGICELIQFHPAYAYEDFIQGIRPVSAGGTLSYPVLPGRFIEFCNRAAARAGTCVLILDEINRANLSQVFGELMYLLEYRDREIRLAAGSSFRIPRNVVLLGTMNTADRSIALVDHALRRRFVFLGLRPLYDMLLRYHETCGFNAAGLVNVLKKVNAAIDDSHFELGISYFMRPFDETGLEDIWRMEIEPYLEEHFYSQREKVEAFRWSSVQGLILVQ